MGVYLDKSWEELMSENYLLEKMKRLKEEDERKGKTLRQDTRLVKVKEKEGLVSGNDDQLDTNGFHFKNKSALLQTFHQQLYSPSPHHQPPLHPPPVPSQHPNAKFHRAILKICHQHKLDKTKIHLTTKSQQYFTTPHKQNSTTDLKTRRI